MFDFLFSFLKKTYLARMTFAEALNVINIEQVGRAHSAIDDAHSLAKMITHLYHRSPRFGQVTDWRNQ